ncbi:DUF1700 domain-containing protein [Saccharothrix xinjiangensis]|uniref:DUF1700 domain-containing protein n=1 Tax=Saccharothrix xinjiangensis TaxID=204798 RepID=A0ABV9XXG3_9PSEU
MNTQTSAEVRDYVARMRAELSDLPAAEVGEIMDDAEAHVAEVAEEMGEELSAAALTARLGTPEVYARELRVAAGYPPRAVEQATTAIRIRAAFLARFAFWSLAVFIVVAFGFSVQGGEEEPLLVLVGLFATVATGLVFWQRGLLAQVEALPETRALREALRRAEASEAGRVLTSLRTLQPAWWVVRALLVVAAGALVYRIDSTLLIALALGALSLVAGPKARTDRRWLWISLPATGFALGSLLFILGSLVGGLGHRSVPVSVYNSPQPSAPTNIYVFDKDGKPLTDVYLYDEDGRPIESQWYGCYSRREDNQYPRPRVEHDERGCREIAGVPFAAIIPNPSSATTAPPPSLSNLPPTPTPTPTPSSAPSSTSSPTPPSTTEAAPTTASTAPTT